MSSKCMRLQDAIKFQQKSPGSFEVPQLGSSQPEESARCAARPRLDHCPTSEGIRDQNAGRSRAASGRHSRGLGRQSGQGCRPISTSRRRGTTARPSTRLTVKDVPVDGVLVDQRLQRARATSRRTRYDAYTINNITAKKDDGRFDRRSSSAAATARSRTACRSWRAGITPCASTVRAPRSWTAAGNSRKRNRCRDRGAAQGPGLDAVPRTWYWRRNW